MNRIKSLWDEKHPELTFFSATNLRDQASRVEKDRVFLETEHTIDENQNNSNVVNNDNTEENFNVKSEHLTINNTLIVTDTEIQSVENPVLEANTLIKETIKEIFMHNITSINSMNFNERKYDTRVNKAPSVDILKTIDDISSGISTRGTS